MMRKKAQRTSLLNTFGKLKEDPFDVTLINRYFRGRKQEDVQQVLSDKICNDLDLHELFQFIDRTTSNIGQQYLYQTFRTIPKDRTQRIKREQYIQQFENNESLRLQVQEQLLKLQSDDAYYIQSLFLEPQVEKPQWYFVVPLLAFTNLFMLLLLPFCSELIFGFMAVFMVNMAIHYWNKQILNQYMNTMPQLLKLIQVAEKLKTIAPLQNIQPNIESTLQILKTIRKRLAIFKFEAHIQGDLQVIFWGFLEIIKVTFLLEPLHLFSALRHINRHRKSIDELFCYVGEIDLYISIASLRHGSTVCCTPNIQSNTFSFEEVKHPLIDNCVLNSIALNSRSALITGSNMSGKTSFIRAIGISAITGLTINTCFAKQVTMPWFYIHSAIRINDDLFNDKSYYLEEVLTIKAMVDASQSGSENLFLLDEIFKGTNTIERIAGGKAVLSRLASPTNIVFVSTHDVELSDLLADRFDLYHFSEQVNGLTIDFDYKLKEGKLKTRNAIRILQMNSYPSALIDEALELSEQLDKASRNTTAK